SRSSRKGPRSWAAPRVGPRRGVGKRRSSGRASRARTAGRKRRRSPACRAAAGRVRTHPASCSSFPGVGVRGRKDGGSRARLLSGKCRIVCGEIPDLSRPSGGVPPAVRRGPGAGPSRPAPRCGSRPSPGDDAAPPLPAAVPVRPVACPVPLTILPPQRTRLEGGSEMAQRNTIARELPVPDFYDTNNAGRWDYRPDEQAVFERAVAWRDEHGLRPAAEDRLRVHLLLIDLQKDFCFPEGTLYVGGRSGRGAVEDNDRIARFIYRNLGVISAITCTLDTHFPHQIFSPAFWVDAEGNPPPPNRQIIAEQIRAGEIRPNPALAPTLAGGDYDWLL